MYVDYTLADLLEIFNTRSNLEIIEFLMDEGLMIKSDPKDFSDLPRGIYRRKDGQDMIHFDGYGGFNFVNPYEDGTGSISWALDPRGQSTWVLILDERFRPVLSGFEFTTDNDGGRIS